LVLPNDEILNLIKERAAAIIGMPATHFEFFQCVSYGPGQEFQSHYDTFDETTPEGSKTIQEEGQRKYTMLAYLNDDFEGGCTYFPDLDYLIQPKKGRVIMFENIDENGVIRKAAYHAGMPVKTGKKYAINMWVHTKPTIPSKYIQGA
jgi:prolyl 4-hydroxylase